MTKMTPREAATATNSNPNAARTAFFGYDEALDNGELLFDVTDTRLLRAIHELPVRTAITWQPGLSLPAVSVDFFDTIDWEWLILTYNGFISTSHIPTGATVNIPDVVTLKTALRTKLRGSTVTI